MQRLLRRWETVLYFTSDCASAPAAKLQSNIFGTHYDMTLDSSVQPFDKSWAAEGGRERSRSAGGSGRSGSRRESLVEILYKTRLKGFMRPRRFALNALTAFQHVPCAFHNRTRSPLLSSSLSMHPREGKSSFFLRQNVCGVH